MLFLYHSDFAAKEIYFTYEETLEEVVTYTKIKGFEKRLEK